ncbi:MAG: transposase [Gammaproteobacteria bacterium]|nr:transposase [Gammaproteobacteria bacterium]
MTAVRAPRDRRRVHQDRGAPMPAHAVANLLAGLGVERSHSRPRVSNDNAFSESQFKRLKQVPSYPGCFDDSAPASLWLTRFFDHDDQRPHQGLALFSSSTVFNGQVDEVIRRRQAASDAHYCLHPERYPNGRAVVRPPPQASTCSDLGHRSLPQ